MKTIRHAWIVSFALLVPPALHAQQPPNPTFSDASHNTAGGTDALLDLILPASFNTAFGDSALANNTSGEFNVAFGGSALTLNTTGSFNTAVGSLSQYTGGGSANVSVGVQSLFAGNGDDNVAIGADSLYSAGSASRNVAIGRRALDSASAGNNIAIGHEAGSNLTTGSYNIEIGNSGEVGESKTIRIGVPGTTLTSQNRAFIAGIYGVTITSGSAVLIDGKGQLGTIVSSGRFKKDVADMGDASSALLKLRPVTFHYKADTTQAQQYGLIAEEVAKVYPDLVVRNESGAIDSVQYHQLAPMLLNELQKQRGEIDALRQERAHDLAQIKEMRALVQEQAAALTMLQTRIDETSQVASR